MSQTRRMSLLETVVSLVIGFAVSVLASYVVYPLHGHSFSLGQNISITLIFTVLSLVRGYVVRRAFNYWCRK
jgi:uncharacterized membrane protein (DUF485 family)